MPFRRITTIPLLIAWFVFLTVAIYWLQDIQINRLEYARPYRGTLNVPRIIDEQGNEIGEDGLPKLATVMAIGYDNLYASLLWLRVIQAFGAKLQHVREDPRELRALENLFWVITELDPRFLDAYKFGSFVLGDEGRDQEAALRLIDRGIIKNYNRPQTWELPRDAIYTCLDREDYDRALYYVRAAGRQPNCPLHVLRVKNHIAAKKGHFEIALEHWVRSMLESQVAADPHTIKIARNQLEKTVNDWHVSILDAALDRYFELHDDYPARIGQLVEEDLIGGVRQVNGTKLMRLVGGAMATGRSVDEAIAMIMGTDERPGCILESNRAPLDLEGRPYLLVDATEIPFQQRPYFVDREAAGRNTSMALYAIRRRIETYRKAHGSLPAHLDDLPGMKRGAAERLQRDDPAGMPWNYDPKTGKISSYVFPGL